MKIMSPMKASVIALALTGMPGMMVVNAAEAVSAIVVNVDNFDKAQTDFEFAGIIKQAGGINKLHSNRCPPRSTSKTSFE